MVRSAVVRSTATAMAVAASVVALSACGGAGQSTASTSSSPTAAGVVATDARAGDSQAPSPAPAPSPDYGQQAKRAVRGYYGAIDSADYSGAWSRLEGPIHAAMGGFATWERGFDSSVSTQVISAVTLAATRTRAEVAVSLRSVDVDACGSRVTQRFKGVWRLERPNGRWLAERIVMRKTSGVTPVSDVSKCPGPTSDSGDVCDPTSTAYDAITCDGQSGGADSGDPCDPNSSAFNPSSCGSPSSGDGSFCDTHSCIDSFDDGTGYIVECSDGEWSHSGGRQGACSYHGGETNVTAP
jgi:hypothetical protein